MLALRRRVAISTNLTCASTWEVGMVRKIDQITYEILHDRGLLVDDVEALARHLQVPQVDPQVVRGHERLPVTACTLTKKSITITLPEQEHGSGAE